MRASALGTENHMNGTAANSRSASAILTLPSRLAFIRSEGFPLIPSLDPPHHLVVAIVATMIAPHNPEVGVLGDRFRPPAWQTNGTLDHLLGTDHLGRDVLSRLIFGARISVIVGLMVIIVAGFVGTDARHHLGLSRPVGRSGHHASSPTPGSPCPRSRSRSSWRPSSGPACPTSSSSSPSSTGRATRASSAARCCRSGSGTSCASPSSPAARSGRSCASTSCPT